jgi:PAS domain S-box-containing protein
METLPPAAGPLPDAAPIAGVPELFRALVDQSPVGTFAADRHGRCTYANAQCRALWFSLANSLDEGWPGSVYPADQPRILAGWSRAAAEGREYEDEFRVEHGGAVRWLRVRTSPLRQGGEWTGHVGIVEDITQRKWTERRLATQHAVTRILSDAESLEAAAPAVLQALGECLGWSFGAFWLPDAAGDALHCAHLWHAPDGAFEAFASRTRALPLPPGVGLPGRVWAARGAVWLQDVARADNFPRGPQAAREGLHAGFGFPIILGGEVLGVVEFFTPELQPPDEPLLAMVASIGSQIGQVLERQRASADLLRAQRELSDFVENASVCLHWVGPDGVILWANQAELDLLGYTREEYIGRPISDFHVDQPVIADILRRLTCGEHLHEVEARVRRKDGSVRHVLVNSSVYFRDGQFIHTRCFTRDVTEQKRAEVLAARQNALLERVARGAPLREVLDATARFVEEQSAGALCSILLLDETRRLRHGAAPSLPEVYCRAIDGTPVGPSAGSCGTAAHRREAVIVTDIAADPLWARYRDLALPHGLRACWSNPILSTAGEVLGSVAMYYTSPRAPTDADRRLTEVATYLAGLAIERARAEEALRAADRRKDEFLAILSHELRNPLTPVLSAVELLRAPAALDPALERQRGVIERQTRHMGRLLDDLLDVSRITRGKIELRKRVVDLREVVRDTVEACRGHVDSRGHSLKVTLDPAPLVVEADPARIHQVIGNLITNAAKYTPPGGVITISAAQHGTALITVADTGEGIDPAFLPHLFDLFAQDDRSLGRAEGGLGIGLTMVKQLVEMHGGTVSVRSGGRGKGSEFQVRLPLAPVQLAAPPDTPPAVPPPAAGLRVLVVDDNRDAAETLGEILELWDHDVRIAYDGASAVRLAAECGPAVVLLDISMPGMDGYEVASALRRQAGLPRPFLIALTGYGQEADRQRARAAGFDHHLTKPVDPERLFRLLNEAARA